MATDVLRDDSSSKGSVIVRVDYSLDVDETCRFFVKEYLASGKSSHSLLFSIAY
jgi:hypothetical protein